MSNRRCLFLDPEDNEYLEIRDTTPEKYKALVAVGFVDVTGDPVHEKLHQLFRAKK